MKKSKLNLNSLNITSFITEKSQIQRILGGGDNVERQELTSDVTEPDTGCDEYCEQYSDYC